MSDSKTTRLTRWLGGQPLRRDADFRVVCIPYAGAGRSAFGGWAARFPAGIEVCGLELPGRWSRHAETPYVRLPPLIADLTADLAPMFERPYILFGYSMGAMVAYELARALRSAGAALPQHLVVAASPPPHRRLIKHEPLHALSRERFIDAMAVHYGGLGPAALSRPEMLEVAYPAMRADMEIIETYSHEPQEPLPCPITAVAGREDAVAPPEEMREWGRHTTSTFVLHEVPGRHFFIAEKPARLQSLLIDLGSALHESPAEM